TGGDHRSTLAKKVRSLTTRGIAVSDIPAETPRVARAYCPACEPDADTLLEILEVQWCNVHMPMREGVDDARVMSDAMLTGSAEAGGDENRRWCDIIHGDSHNRRRHRDGVKTQAS
ncbi:MAG TPA: hypothetical protein VLA62_14010, partial [Solirubrobacterales bacterium]|nr:hypothetical protein [Solirubrobacterales bacterium]